jgi:hypothetical protein
MRVSRGVSILAAAAAIVAWAQTAVDVKTQLRNTAAIGSPDAAANAIPRAGADGKLSPDWLDLSGYQLELGFVPLNPADNLADVANAASARSHLGLGAASVKNVQGSGGMVPTVSGAFAAGAIPVVDSTGTQVDSGCTASGGGLTCASGSPTRIGVTKGAAPTDTTVNGAAYDAVLFLDTVDNSWKIRRQDGTVSSMTSTGGSITPEALRDIAYCADTSGAPNTITCTTGSGSPGYSAGQAIWVKMANTNTGSVNVNVNGSGAAAVTRNGSAMTAGELSAGGMYLLLHDGTQFHAQVGGPGAAAGAPSMDCTDPTTVCLVDHFFPGSTTIIGQTRWSSIGTGATLSVQNGEPGHAGIYGLTTSASANGVAGIDLSGSSVRPLPAINSLASTTLLWKFKTPAEITEWAFAVGVGPSPSSIGFSDSGIHVEYINNTGCTTTGNHTAFQFLTRGSGGSTAGIGLGVQPNTWYWIRMYTTLAGTVYFQMKADGDEWTTPLSSTTGYTAGGIPYIKHGTCNATAKLLKVDEFRYYATGLN